jgi:trans-2,3-dihydro-3-hydroxyanthranilate isomerase
VPTLPYHVVDVFTDRPFAGNPLAVVFDADDLPTAALQEIAREFHLSETAFPMRSAVADYRLRIFTPIQELPFAGHPSVGTAWLLAQQRRIKTGGVTQECGVGVLPIEVTEVGATLTGGPPTFGEALDPAPVSALLGLVPADIGDVPPRIAGAGVSFLYLAVPPDVVGRLRVPNEAALLPVLTDLGVLGLVAFAWAADERKSHARVFVPGIGEDPATGAAAVGFGVYLASSGLVDPDGTTSYTIEQGAEIHRPSVLTGTVTCAGGSAVATTVGGRVVHLATGELVRPPSAGRPPEAATAS